MGGRFLLFFFVWGIVFANCFFNFWFIFQSIVLKTAYLSSSWRNALLNSLQRLHSTSALRRNVSDSSDCSESNPLNQRIIDYARSEDVISTDGSTDDEEEERPLFSRLPKSQSIIS